MLVVGLYVLKAFLDLKTPTVFSNEFDGSILVVKTKIRSGEQLLRFRQTLSFRSTDRSQTNSSWDHPLNHDIPSGIRNLKLTNGPKSEIPLHGILKFSTDS